MSDEIHTEGGATVGGNVDAKKFTGRDNTDNRQHRDARSYADPSQNLYLNNAGGDDRFQYIYTKINEHTTLLVQNAYQISDLIDKWRDLNFKLDNTPEKLDILTGRTDRQDGRIQNLENRALEVVVRPGPSPREPEVIIRPAADPNSLTNQQLAKYMLIGFVLVVGAVLYLVYLQAARGG